MAIETLSKHTAYINDRGGTKRLHELKNLSLVRWGRVRDDTSAAKIQLSSEATDSQRQILEGIEPGRHELCLFRGQERVWEGPVLLPTFNANGCEIEAKDISFYLARTVMHAGYDSSHKAFPTGEKVIARMMRVLQTELGGPGRKETLDPPYNILPHVVAHQFVTDAETARITDPYQMSVFEHLDDLAAKAGIDYTVVGRALHMWDTSRPALGKTRTLTEKDFLGPIVVSVYGAELATRSIVTDGQGGFGQAGGVDPYYGEWEILSTAYDEEEGGPLPTKAELDSQALRNQGGRNPTPVMLRVPDNSSLNLSGTLTIADLVPGVYMPVLARLGARPVSQMQKLQSVTVEESSRGEAIKVSLYPATKEDVVEDE